MRARAFTGCVGLAMTAVLATACSSGGARAHQAPVVTSPAPVTTVPPGIAALCRHATALDATVGRGGVDSTGEVPAMVAILDDPTLGQGVPPTMSDLVYQLRILEPDSYGPVPEEYVSLLRIACRQSGYRD